MNSRHAAVALARTVATATVGLLITTSSSSAETEGHALFQDAVRAASAGNARRACELFEQSYAAEPASGTLMNVAGCREQAMDFVGAYNTFADAGEMAARDGKNERVEVARSHMAALEAKVARVRLRTSEPLANDQTITVDGREEKALADRPIAVSTGRHTLEIRHRTSVVWSGTVDAEVGQLKEISASGLRGRPSALPLVTTPESSPSAAPSTSSPLRTVGFVLAGVGVVGLGVGAVTGISALQKKSDAGKTNVPADRNRLNDDGRSVADVSTVAFIVSGVVLAGGVALVLTAPKSESRAPRAAWVLAPTLGSAPGATLRTQF